MENHNSKSTNNSSHELVNSLIKNEYKSILGKNRRGLYFLVAILTLTFISLGHVLEGLKALDKSMNNPFTNWVNIYKIGDRTIDDFNEKINTANKEEYGIRNIKEYTRTYWEILKPGLDQKYKVSLRDVGMDDPIYNAILERKNLILKNDDLGFDRCGIIVKKEMLINAGYSNLSSLKKLAVIFPNKGYDHIILLNVHAIVDELPNEVDMIIPTQLAALEYSGAEFIQLGSTSSIYFLSKNRLTLEAVRKANIFDVEEVTEMSSQFDYYQDEYFYYEFFLSQKVPYTKSIELTQQIKTKFKCININPYNCSPIEDNYDRSYVAYNFNDLSKINTFSAFAKSQGVEIPLHQVRSKENFILVSRIAALFIFLLVIFSTASILLYLKNTLQNHLESIKPNLGTLKAFGLNDSTITKVYLFIIYRFFIIASLIAFAISIVYHLISLNINLSNFFFNIFDIWILVIWLFIGFILYLFYKTTVIKILKRAPGDLIYNR